MLEKTLESSLDWTEFTSVNPKGNQLCYPIRRRADAEVEAPILWLPDVKTWLVGKDPEVMKHWRQKEKGMAEDEMVR